MKATTLILAGISISAGITSCSSDAGKKDVPKQLAQSLLTTASTSPKDVVQRFLTWYRPKRVQLGSLPIVPAWLTDYGDTTDIYKVDFTVAEQYLNAFKASGFVSEKYLANEHRKIQKADSTMQADRQSSGPPEGLNYDFVVFSQDPDADLVKLLRTKPAVSINGDAARVYYSQLPKPEDLREGADLEFSLVRQQGKWLIENIRPVFAN